MKKATLHPTRTLIVVLLLTTSSLLAALQVHAQSDVILPSIGGRGGGPFTARCAEGRLLTGVELRVGDDVDAIRPICAVAYSPGEAGPLEIYPSKFGGNGGGGDVQLLCPRDNPIVGRIYINAEGVRTITVNNIHLFCGAAAANQSLSQYPSAKFDGPKAKPDEGLFGLDTDGVQLEYGAQQCPAGLVAVGIAGRAGIWLDALGLICGAPKLTHAPVKAQGRVRVDPATTVRAQGRVRPAPVAPPSSPKPICELARAARDRNSPAAPGLEQTCRAELAATGAAISQLDPIVASERNIEPAAQYRFGFDVATGIFGDPANGALGNTATGPGSLGLRNGLDAIGQRGFNDSVTLHLARDYKRAPAPTITATGAVGTDPATVSLAGQTERTVNVRWNASPDFTYCEIYLSIDNGPWSELGRGGQGTTPLTIKLGQRYTFRMMVYEGQAGTPQIIKTFTVNGAR